jgi:predicted DNA-binding transcriptional regulator AlpA
MAERRLDRDSREWLTTRQILEFLQIGRTKLWELVRNGAFPAYRLGDGPNAGLRYRRSDIVRWLENRRVMALDRTDPEPRVASRQR